MLYMSLSEDYPILLIQPSIFSESSELHMLIEQEKCIFNQYYYTIDFGHLCKWFDLLSLFYLNISPVNFHATNYWLFLFIIHISAVRHLFMNNLVLRISAYVWVWKCCLSSLYQVHLFFWLSLLALQML